MSSLDQPPEIAAAARNQKVVLPGPRDLFVDIDSEEALTRYYSLLGVLTYNSAGVKQVMLVPSKSGKGHYHIYLRADHDLEPIERIALQAVLGSDPVREALGYLRAQRGTRPPTTFFEAPDFDPPETCTCLPFTPTAPPRTGESL